MKSNHLYRFMLATWLLMLGAVIGILFSCQGNQGKTGDHPQGNFSISGAFALYPLTVKWVEEFRKDYPDVQVDVSAGGAGKGMADVLADMVDLGMFSREVTPVESEKGAWYIAVAKDAVVPTINDVNPFKEFLLTNGMSQQQLTMLFSQDKKWLWKDINAGIHDESPIHIYTRSDACGAAQVWASFLGTNQESLRGIGVFGDPGMTDAVKKDVMGIGYNNVAYAFDVNTRQKYEGIDILPVDFDGNGMIDHNENVYQSLDSLMAAISMGRYPSPPVRDLYFISKGKPDNELVNLFLNWVLTKGQQYVSQAGYVGLSNDQIPKQLLKLTDEAN
ncbi:MAG: PstS family phosphate ABC transporter substrate-binding protein [Bacteroidales bacterium]|nr:PstS family phosphate ABC transporter substrate-binding protein [Bacteroidales bacterium]